MDETSSSPSNNLLDMILNTGSKIFGAITAKDAAKATAAAEAARTAAAAAAANKPAATPVNWKLIGGIGAAVVVVIALVFMLRKS